MLVNDGERPFFIVGSGRSGTTLLRMILCSHSRIAIPPETWFLLDLVTGFPLQSRLDDEQLHRAVEQIVGHYRWPDLEIDAEQFARDAKQLNAPTIRALSDMIYQTICLRENRPRWGDKTPPYVRIVPQLAELYPNAQFVYLVRDGRDVASSFQSKRWYGRWLVDNAREWVESIAYMREYRSLLDAKRLFELKYEDLVRSPEQLTRELCHFLGEDFEPEMLNWMKRVRQQVPERELHIHEKLMRPPGPGDIARWERELPKLQLLSLEAHIGKELEESGYALHYGSVVQRASFPVVRFARALFLPIVKAIIRVRAAVKRRLLPTAVTDMSSKSSRR